MSACVSPKTLTKWPLQIQILSILSPRWARILHAHFDWATQCLTVRRSNTIDLNVEDENQLHPWLSWLLSNPVGDTRSPETLHVPAVVLQDFDGTSGESGLKGNTLDSVGKTRLLCKSGPTTSPCKTSHVSATEDASSSRGLHSIDSVTARCDEALHRELHRSYSDSQIGLVMRRAWRR